MSNTLHINQEVRPLRLCFVVGRKKENILEAMEINTRLWSGLHNPIISVKKTADKKEIRNYLGIIWDFEPDFVIHLSGRLPSKFKKGLKKKPITKSEFFTRRDGIKVFSKGLNNLYPLSLFLDDSRKPKDVKDKITKLEAEKGVDQLHVATLFGHVNDGSIKHFEEQHKLKQVSVSSDEHIPEILSLDLINLLEATEVSLQRAGGRQANRDYVYLYNPNNKDSLVDYWNLRASGKNILPVQIEHYEKYENLLKKFISDIKVDGGSIYPWTIYTGGDIVSAEVTTIIEWIESVAKSGVNTQANLEWGIKSSYFSRDFACIRTFNKREKQLAYMSEGNIQTFLLPAPTFIENEQVTMDSRQRWAVDLSFIGFHERAYTLSLPNQTGMERLAKYELVFGGHDDVGLNSQGLTIFAGNKEKTVNLNPVAISRVIESMFSDLGLETKKSRPGEYADSIIESMGGLESCRHFKIRGVREVLKKLNRKKITVKIGRKTTDIYRKGSSPLVHSEISRIIGDTNVDTFGAKNWEDDLYSDLTLYRDQKHPLTPSIAFEYLIKKNILLPILKFQCIKCGEKSWNKTGSFDEYFTCQYCYEKQNVPPIHKQDWFYKTKGLLSIANEGQGSIPVILSLWRLNHVGGTLGDGKYVTSHEVKSLKGPELKGEIDYVYYTVGTFDKDKTELVLGEARTYKDFTKKDIKKVLNLASRFREKPYIAFTTMKEEFSASEKELFRMVLSSGYLTLLLTRRETDPYDLYKRFDALPNKHAITLREFGINTTQLNLGITEADINKLMLPRI